MKLEWNKHPGSFSTIAAGYTLKLVDGVPFTGYGLTITEWRDDCDAITVGRFCYHAANRRVYFCHTFKEAEAGIRRVIRTLRKREQNARVAEAVAHGVQFSGVEAVS